MMEVGHWNYHEQALSYATFCYAADSYVRRFPRHPGVDVFIASMQVFSRSPIVELDDKDRSSTAFHLDDRYQVPARNF